MGTQHIGIRLPEQSLQQLSTIAEMKKISPNQLAKIAILEWLDTHWLRKNDLISIPKKNFAAMLEMLDSKQRKKYSDQIAMKVIEFYEFNAQVMQKFTELEEFIEKMIIFVGEQGVCWFKEIFYSTQVQPLFFKGLHDMGQTWSEVFLEIFTAILSKKQFNFQLVEERTLLTDSMVYLEFEKKKSS